MARRTLKQEHDEKPSLQWLWETTRNSTLKAIDRSNIQPRFNGFRQPTVFRTTVYVASTVLGEVEA